MSEEGGSLATKTEKVSHFFFLTMARKRASGWGGRRQEACCLPDTLPSLQLMETTDWHRLSSHNRFRGSKALTQ